MGELNENRLLPEFTPIVFYYETMRQISEP